MHSPEPHWLNVEKDVRINLYYGNEKIEDSAERFIGCYNACRGLNPEVVPELVAALGDLIDYAEGACDEGYGSCYEQSDGMIAAINVARELLAKVKA